ncbi:MAG: PHB depolymerase family esterase, partial [Planctomycetota bacterium]|nr:PHB depolymerase family esterase [Planctomycetota bacterium]
MERTYRVFQPTGLSGDRAAPLVFAFHGGSGNAKQAQRHYGFDVLAQKHGFLVVYPEAIDGHWNDGRNGEKFAVQNRTVDDVAYFRAVLKQVKADHKVDADRIYAMGASNGGMFVQRLALEETRTFAAVASTISSLPKPLKSDFKPKAPLSVLFL